MIETTRLCGFVVQARPSEPLVDDRFSGLPEIVLSVVPVPNLNCETFSCPTDPYH